jgi:hypothetical protein
MPVLSSGYYPKGKVQQFPEPFSICAHAFKKKVPDVTFLCSS